jgi:hypothetical protein
VLASPLVAGGARLEQIPIACDRVNLLDGDCLDGAANRHQGRSD